MSLLLGIDIGTSNIKASLFSYEGRELISVSKEHPLQSPRPGWVEQNPNLWWEKVKECIDSFNGKLEIYTLPGYSPELNPVEQVWNNVKNHGIGRKKAFGPDQLKSMVLGQLRKLQKLPSIVKSFFRHPECSYTLV